MSPRTEVDDSTEVRRRVERIAALVAELEDLPDPAVRGRVDEVLRAVLELHGAGLQRLLDLVGRDGERGESLLAVLADDPEVAPLLHLHGLHPVPVHERVEQALEDVRPYLRSHGGDVELLGVTEDGRVRLRLEGSCHGCPSSASTMRLAVERAILDAAPEIEEIEVEGMVEAAPRGGAASPPAAGVQPLPLAAPGAAAIPAATSSGRSVAAGPATGPATGEDRSARRRGELPPLLASAAMAATLPVGPEDPPSMPTAPPSVAAWRAPTHQATWVRVDSLASLGEAEVRPVEVEGRDLVACRVGGTLYAYRAGCPRCGAGLGHAALVDAALVCPGCASRFEVLRAGRSPEGSEHLEPVPLLEDGETVRLALTVPA